LTAVSPQQAAAQHLHLLDVRNVREYQERRIPGAQPLPMGSVIAHLGDIPTAQTVAIQCGSGVRSQIVASVLQRAGFSNIVNLDGGIDAWKAAGLPVDES
jgi:hydroxyacylglutathione hydrolase